MRYVYYGVVLIVLMFTNLVLAVATYPVLSLTTDTIGNLVVGETYASTVTGFFAMLNTAFWIVFVISAVGLIIWYLVGSHMEEYEQYQQYGRQR